MLLGFIAGILNTHIGQYFENIDPSQLTGNILFGGGVTLNNLNFRKTIFESLGLPFHVVGGKCGTLQVNYSLRRIYSEPIVVTLKDLYLLIIPSRDVKYDAEAEKASLQQEKLRQLEIFESIKNHIKQNNVEKPSTAGDSRPQEGTYLDSWVMQVIRNIRFQIESLHIRFEDDVTNKKYPFAVGLTLQNLTVHTTDSSWISQYVRDYVPETMYKLVMLTGLSVYWNPAPTSMYKGITDQQLLFSRLAVMPTSEDTGFRFCKTFWKSHCPVSLDIKIQITPFPDYMQHPFSKPRVLLETSRDELILSLSDKQFKDIFLFLDTIDQLITSYKHRRYRPGPDIPYKGNYKKWWRFAYNCTMHDILRRRNNFRWKNILEHRQKSRRYIKAYYQKKIEKKVSTELDNTIAELEKELDLFNLILLRKQVYLIQARHNPAEHGEASSWLSSWLYAAPTSVPATVSSVNVGASGFSAEEKEELQVAVGFANKIYIHNYPEDYVDLEVSVLLNKFRIILHRSPNRIRETLLDTLLDRFAFSLRTRPVGNGVHLELKLGRIEAYGGDFPKDPVSNPLATPQIITTANPGVTEYFIKLMYEKAPLSSEVDHKISVEGLALQFTYHPDTIEKLIQSLAIPPSNNHVKFRPIPATKVLNRIMQFRAASTGRLLRMMENKGKVELSVCLVAPFIVIPMDVTAAGKSNFVVLNLGEINMFGTIIGGTICQNGACTDLL